MPQVRCDLMSISPKLANSTPHDRDGGRWAAQHERLRYQPEILKRLIARYPYQLKFVITDPARSDRSARDHQRNRSCERPRVADARRRRIRRCWRSAAAGWSRFANRKAFASARGCTLNCGETGGASRSHPLNSYPCSAIRTHSVSDCGRAREDLPHQIADLLEPLS